MGKINNKNKKMRVIKSTFMALLLATIVMLEKWTIESVNERDIDI